MADYVPLDYSYESLQKRMERMWETIWTLQEKIEDLSNNTEEKKVVPYTKSGGNQDIAHKNPIDISTGMIPNLSGAIVWNDAELKFTPYGTKPTAPEKGYNRHSHSRLSGGALDVNTLEIIDYKVTWETDPTYNKDCQSLWKITPQIKTEKNSKNEDVEKIGKLDLIFNPDTIKWGVASYEIDVEKCYLVRRYKTGDTLPAGKKVGDIMIDTSGKEMKSKLLIETKFKDESGVEQTDISKSAVVWDVNASVFRFFAIYAEEPPKSKE